MKVYTYSEARQRLAALLNEALAEGEVRIRRRDGTVFVLRPLTPTESPLEVPSLNLGFRREEIVDFVREARRYPRGAGEGHPDDEG